MDAFSLFPHFCWKCGFYNRFSKLLAF
uniref:Linolenate hydroperoxide lyaseic n=1 Tax=Rhizophora mucronata TaxID=61149 RepID=A0A2P2NNZ3_RHIMU